MLSVRESYLCLALTGGAHLKGDLSGQNNHLEAPRSPKHHVVGTVSKQCPHGRLADKRQCDPSIVTNGLWCTQHPRTSVMAVTDSNLTSHLAKSREGAPSSTWTFVKMVGVLLSGCNRESPREVGPSDLCWRHVGLSRALPKGPNRAWQDGWDLYQIQL